MKMLDIIDRADLKRDYKKSDAWIKKFGRLAGGHGKPMTWIREDFEAFERAMRAASNSQRADAIAAKQGIDKEISQIVRQIFSARSAQSTPREMKGHGGRGYAP